MSRLQMFSLYGGLLVLIAALLGIVAQRQPGAKDCNTAVGLATMSRAQAEACFRWNWN